MGDSRDEVEGEKVEVKMIKASQAKSDAMRVRTKAGEGELGQRGGWLVLVGSLEFKVLF